MRTIIATGTMLTPDQALKDHTLIIEGERIAAITDQPVPELPGDKHLDLRSYTVVPGFIDVHVHGADGADTMDATPASLHRMGRYFARYGVTAFLPTTMAASAVDIEAAIQNFSALSDHDDSARPVGIHLEGPYLNETYRGAQPAQHLRVADPREYKAWLAHREVRLITAAPETDGVPELIRAGVQAGIEFAVGHSGATYEQVLSAADFGLRQATHVFNGMAGLRHRVPGVLGAILSDDRIRAQIIADGVHVHPAVVRLLIKMKGTDRTILITDAIRASGMPDGDYMLGDQRVHSNGGVPRTETGDLAGSTLTMDQALRNVMEFAHLSLLEALPMATRTPAAALGLNHRKGSLAPDLDADLVVLDETNHVRLTMVEGHVAYKNL
jgi:N-acetylglucosamine-6-phosphate deacetylase